MSFRGKHVPAAVVADATWLLATFNEETGRNITATARTLQRIVGALLDAPEVPVERWQQAVKLTVADPPSWVDGQLQLGHIFGPNAAQHALAKTEKPASARTSIDRFMAAQDKAQRRAA